MSTLILWIIFVPNFNFIPIINITDWANNEQQHYTDRIDNSYVSDGTLKIKAIKENYTSEKIFYDERNYL